MRLPVEVVLVCGILGRAKPLGLPAGPPGGRHSLRRVVSFPREVGLRL